MGRIRPGKVKALMDETVLLTGAAGFIGSHVAERLIGEGCKVVGMDNFCDFYDPARKRSNLAGLLRSDRFTLVEGDIRDRHAVEAVFAAHAPDGVVHLAAMAGVRPSIERPSYYTDVNVNGTSILLDAAVKHNVNRFVFASSSSVYGNNEKVPFSEDDPVDYPISPYAATKRSCELICHAFWHIHRLPVFCLRFFTVYGPRQRPDLAIAKFLRLVAAGEPIPLFGDGSTSRDYSYIDDIVDGVMSAIDRCDRFRIYNLGGSSPVTLSELVDTIGQVVGRPVEIDSQPMQPGDVNRTYADLSRSKPELGYAPTTELIDGIHRQWAWMREQGLAD